MNDDPLVSVVTPSYNQGRFIEDTLRSVKEQDYPNVEHIVVDGASTDETTEVLRRYEDQYNLRWESRPDRNRCHALNKGFRRARGEIVGWINSDDVYFHPGVFRKVSRCFKRNPDVDALYGHRGKIDASNHLFEIRPSPPFSRQRLKRISFIPQCTVFFRQSVVKRYEVDESLLYPIDIDYFLRVSREHSWQLLDDVMACFRFHPDSTTKRRSGDMDPEFWEELQELRNRYPPASGWRYALRRTTDKFQSAWMRVRGYWLHRRIRRGDPGLPSPFPFIQVD